MKKNGEAKYYWSNGNLQSIVTYKDDLPTVIWKDYYEYGYYIESETPYKNGMRNGLKKEYYAIGKLKEETPFVDGKENGTVTGYYKNGNSLLHF